MSHDDMGSKALFFLVGPSSLDANLFGSISSTNKTLYLFPI